MPQQYPFCAVVGADEPDGPFGEMALALLLTTISPEVGGVLVRGQKGTAKSTIVRALAAVLPHIDVVAGDRFSSDPRDDTHLSPDGPFAGDVAVESRPVRLVELPVGATEDRVLGSLHLERALSEGRTEYEPGLLARAHRGLLYVDEVNLLHDHLVDVLLDAAAMGRATVERDGVSLTHAARFVLVGTMNPEEGELRPQLLDRFGLSVEVAAPDDPALRAEVVRRRIAFDADPAGFSASYAAAQAALTERVRTAQEQVSHVELTDAALLRIAELCAAFGVDGLRADIVTARTAVAHAAWQGRDRVVLDDIRAAARLALPHRRRRNPFDAPGMDDELLDQVLGDDLPEPPDPEPEPDPDGPSDPNGPGDPSGTSYGEDEGTSRPYDVPQEPEDDGEPGSSDPADNDAGAGDRPAGGGSPVSAGQPYRARLFTAHGFHLAQAPQRGSGEPGPAVDAGIQFARRHHLDLGTAVEIDELDQQKLDPVLLDPCRDLIPSRHRGSPNPMEIASRRPSYRSPS